MDDAEPIEQWFRIAHVAFFAIDLLVLVLVLLKLRLLMVVTTERYEAIRIVSARKANVRETERYFGPR